MKAFFVGAKVLEIDSNSPFCRVEIVPEGSCKLDTREFQSKLGKAIKIRQVGGQEELGASVEMFEQLRKLDVGKAYEFGLEPDPANFQRVRIASVQ